MERKDYNRQVKWLMGEIKDQLSHEKSTVWVILGLLVVLGSFAYIYYESCTFHDMLIFAVMTVGLLIYLIFNRVLKKRMLRAATADELLSVNNILNIGEWVVALGELLLSFSGRGLAGMIFLTVMWILQMANQKLWNKTELEVNVERLREVLKEGTDP